MIGIIFFWLEGPDRVSTESVGTGWFLWKNFRFRDT